MSYPHVLDAVAYMVTRRPIDSLDAIAGFSETHYTEVVVQIMFGCSTLPHLGQ